MFLCQVAFSQVLYNNHQDYLLNRMVYRENHESRVFIEPLGNNYESGSELIDLLASSLLSENLPVSIFSIRLAINFGDWFLFTEPWIVNDYYGKDILGTKKTRYNLMGKYLRSYLKYNGDSINFKLGRFSQRWGQSWSHSLLFSLYALPFDQASIQLNLGNWDFDIFSGSFSSEILNDSTLINRHIAGHRISRLFFDDRLLVEAGEVVLYTGENRSWDIQYLSPLSLYYIDLFSPSNYQRKGQEKHNNENAIMLFSMRWFQARDLSFYGEFLLDDFQVDDKGRQNKLGWKIGMDGSTKFKDCPITYEVEYTCINSWTYLNRGQLTNFENLKHTAGYPFGPDNQGIRLQIDGWLSEKLLFDVEHTNLTKGINTLQLVPNDLNNINTMDDPFPKPPVITYNLLDLSLSWWMKHCVVEVGWSNIPFANKIAYDGDVTTVGTFYLKLQSNFCIN